MATIFLVLNVTISNFVLTPVTDDPSETYTGRVVVKDSDS